MVDYGLLCVGNTLHMECLWFCFSKLLQDDLDKVKDHWNSHNSQLIDMNESDPLYPQFKYMTFIYS